MKKRVFAVLLICALVMTCFACDNRADEYSINSVVTITYLTIGDKPSNGQSEKVIEKLNTILRKKANAQLDVYYVGWDDYLANYDKVLSSGEVNLDLVATSSDWLDAWPNAIGGNFMPLTEDMLSKYCPLTYNCVSKEQWQKCSYQGKIYFIPENEFTQWVNHGFIYRKDIADKAGLNGVSSWKDLDAYFRYVKEEYPNMVPWDANGTSTIGTLGYLMSVRKFVPIYELGTYGIWGAYQEDPQKIVSPYYEGDEFVEYAKLMKEWKELGVWRDKLSDAEDNDEEFYSGMSAVIQHHTQNYYTIIKPRMEVMLPDADVDFYWFGKESGNVVKNSILHGAMAIYAGSKNPEKALMVYDLLRNDRECYDLIHYGIEGEQYEKNSEGMLERPSGYNADRDSILLNFWWGRRDEYEIKDATYSWEDYYKLMDEYEKYAIDYPWDSVPFASSDILDEIRPIIEVCNKYVPKIAYGQYDVTPEEEVAEFRTALKNAGIETVTRKLQIICNSH